MGKSNVMRAQGFAVLCDDEILVATVSPTERAAIVNWLVMRGFMVLRLATDTEIYDAFHKAQTAASPHFRLTVLPVTITLTEG
jgi:hypothetical protein